MTWVKLKYDDSCDQCGRRLPAGDPGFLEREGPDSYQWLIYCAACEAKWQAAINAALDPVNLPSESSIGG